MMGLAELRKNRDLVDAIDWDMSPEEAVRLYLEWGNNWSRGYRMIRSKEDATYYFVLNTWEEVPVVYFIRRASEGAVELARVELPERLNAQMHQGRGIQRGVYAVEDGVRDWLKEELDA
ncbi:MAG: hypothetical protein K9N21_12140 [Deltaproteobacteria bacterium]|nr:hypothetical protein [Deltaproteobacteria bacterium]